MNWLTSALKDIKTVLIFAALLGIALWVIQSGAKVGVYEKMDEFGCLNNLIDIIPIRIKFYSLQASLVNTFLTRVLYR
jgi:hypothetical protein